MYACARALSRTIRPRRAGHAYRAATVRLRALARRRRHAARDESRSDPREAPVHRGDGVLLRQGARARVGRDGCVLRARRDDATTSRRAIARPSLPPPPRATRPRPVPARHASRRRRLTRRVPPRRPPARRRGGTLRKTPSRSSSSSTTRRSGSTSCSRRRSSSDGFRVSGLGSQV